MLSKQQKLLLKSMEDGAISIQDGLLIYYDKPAFRKGIQPLISMGLVETHIFSNNFRIYRLNKKKKSIAEALISID